ncbi:MAG: hypothetical protein IJT97_03200 [Bacteroidaceae bacterium]|nr:hypothetical protein [Bacteroidaceae bacterium]
MEDLTATLMAARNIADDTLAQNFAAFTELIANSGFFIVKGIRLDIIRDVGTAIVPLKEQHMMDDFLEKLIGVLNVNILYYIKSLDGNTCKMVAYSMPYHDEMYIVGMESEQYGIVEEVTVTFFESLDVMFLWLQKNLESVMDTKDQVIERQAMTDLYRNFM